jgi:hypothetical protein
LAIPLLYRIRIDNGVFATEPVSDGCGEPIPRQAIRTRSQSGEKRNCGGCPEKAANTSFPEMDASNDLGTPDGENFSRQFRTTLPGCHDSENTSPVAQSTIS